MLYYDEINIQIENCSGIADAVSNNLYFNVYPNPASQSFSIQALNNINSEVNIKLFDTQGKVLVAEKLNHISKGSRLNWDISQFAEGIYYLNIISSEESSLKRISIIR